MKLRNKKTGEIREIKNILIDGMFSINSLAELNEEWEDYEESKEYWFINWCSDVEKEPDEGTEADKACEAIGNKFKTKEEAEKAVEKLMAWKRLKDKGFRFACYTRRSDWAGLSEVKALENLLDITAYLPKDKIKEMKADLDLLFRGEE